MAWARSPRDRRSPRRSRAWVRAKTCIRNTSSTTSGAGSRPPFNTASSLRGMTAPLLRDGRGGNARVIFTIPCGARRTPRPPSSPRSGTTVCISASITSSPRCSIRWFFDPSTTSIGQTLWSIRFALSGKTLPNHPTTIETIARSSNSSRH